MDRVRKQLGVWVDSREEWTRRPVTVGVLDSGVGYHPDLQGRVISFRDFVDGKEGMYDDYGHGTHICGIICGSGVMSGGRFAGMAPGGRLVIGKVLNDRGDGLTQTMLEGMEWMLRYREKYGIRIVNISVGIGHLEEKEKIKALQEMSERLWDSGIVVVCAAGNKGPKEGTVSAMAESRKVVTVGCHDGGLGRNDPGQCENYSGRGSLGAEVRKPDLVAPGTKVISCNVAPGEGTARQNLSGLGKLVYTRRQPGAGDLFDSGNHFARQWNPYVAKSGTSMAAAIVSGAAALLLQKSPDLDGEEVKRRLTFTATDLEEPWNKQGWGMLNVRKLLQ